MTIKLVIGNKTYDAKIVKKIYSYNKNIRVRRRDKEYNYNIPIYTLTTSIPESFKDKVLIVLAVDKNDLVQVDKDVYILKIA